MMFHFTRDRGRLIFKDFVKNLMRGCSKRWNLRSYIMKFAFKAEMLLHIMLYETPFSTKYSRYAIISWTWIH